MGVFDLPRLFWKCPKCNWQINTDEEPTCEKCGSEMEKEK